MSNSGQPITDNQLPITKFFLVIFFLSNLLLSTFFLDFWTSNANTTSRILPVVAYYEQGSYCIDNYEKLTIDKALVNGHYYSVSAPLPTWLIIPVAGVLRSIGFIDLGSADNWLPLYLLGAFLIGSVPFALIMLLTFMAICRGRSSVKKNISAVLLSTLPFYASFLFVFSGTFFGHIFSGALLLAAYISIKRRNYLWSGFFLGLCFLCEYTLAFFLLFWALQIWVNEKKIKYPVVFALGFLPSLIVLFIYNYSITGVPTDMLYKYHIFDSMDQNYGFNSPSLQSIFGLSFSPYRGMFIYAPFLFLLLYMFIKKLSEFGVTTLINNYLVLPCILFFLVIASYSYWDGGWSYGPRLLTGVTILLIYEGVNYLSRNEFSSKIFWITVSFGFVCALMAKMTIVYSVPDDIHNPVSEQIMPAFLKGDLNQNNVLTHLFGIKPMYALIVFILLFISSVFSLDYWSKSDASKHSYVN